jgi:hypothetical protein
MLISFVSVVFSRFIVNSRHMNTSFARMGTCHCCITVTMSHDGDSARSTANPKHSPSQVKEVNSHRGQTPWTATHVIATRGTTRDNAAPDDPRQLRCAGARPSPTAVAQIDGERAQRAQRAQGAASPRRLAAQAQRTTAPRLCTALTCHAVLALMQREQEAVLVRIPEAHLLRHHANHILGRARARAAVCHADGAPPNILRIQLRDGDTGTAAPPHLHRRGGLNKQRLHAVVEEVHLAHHLPAHHAEAGGLLRTQHTSPA